MGWNLKQKVQDHIVSIGLGLIVLLLLIVWRAVPSSAWDRVSEATPKRALWALLGLEAIAIVVLVALALNNRRKRKHTEAQPEPVVYLRFFGLFWDEDLNPLCPADQTMLTFFMRHATDRFDIFQCARCGQRFPIHHENLGNLQLAAARQMIRDELLQA